MSPTVPQLIALRALLDRLIPADASPGALAALTDQYVLQQLKGDCTVEAADLLLGLTQLDTEAATLHGPQATFATLTLGRQDALLRALERNRPATSWPAALPANAFFQRLVELAHEGFYADPANGGNHDSVSWKMLGYDSGLPKKS